LPCPTNRPSLCRVSGLRLAQVDSGSRIGAAAIEVLPPGTYHYLVYDCWPCRPDGAALSQSLPASSFHVRFQAGQEYAPVCMEACSVRAGRGSFGQELGDALGRRAVFCWARSVSGLRRRRLGGDRAGGGKQERRSYWSRAGLPGVSTQPHVCRLSACSSWQRSAIGALRCPPVVLFELATVRSGRPVLDLAGGLLAYPSRFPV